MPTRYLVPTAALLAFAFAAGCSGGGSPDAGADVPGSDITTVDAADAGDTADASDAAVDAPCVPVSDASGTTFAAVWAEVMGMGRCAGSGCHDQGTSSPHGLDMTTMDSALLNLVGDGGVPAFTAEACRPMDVMLRVAAGDPDHSMIWRRVSGTTCAEQMPLGRAPISCADQNLIRAWILSGAR